MVPSRPLPQPTPACCSTWCSPRKAALWITLAAGLVYSNSFRVPFVFDDDVGILQNPSIRHLTTAWLPPPEITGMPSGARPVVNFSFGLSYAMSGESVWSYHAFNLLLHICAALVLFGIVRRTLLRPPLVTRFGHAASTLALACALLWTVHPLQTESVTYISQRAEALVGLFYLLTLWCFIKASIPAAGHVWTILAFVAALFGMATKEVMVSAPLFVALYARAFLAQSWQEVWKLYGQKLTLIACSWILLGWIVYAEGGARGVSAGFGLGVSWWNYLLKQCEAIVTYLKLSLWPRPLVLDYGTSIVHSLSTVWWQAALLVCLFCGTIWTLVQKPAVGCLGAWFFMILAPSSSVVPLVGQTMAEHRMYLPLAAIVIGVVLLMFVGMGNKSFLVLALGALALGITTVRRNSDYASTIRICEDTVAKRPDNARAMALLANYHHQAGNSDKTLEWLERSLQIQPGVVPVLNNLGNIWQERGENLRAIDCYEQALARKPNDLTTLNNLGNALIISGRTDEGIDRLKYVRQLSPNAWESRANLANAFARAGRLPEAAQEMEVVVKHLPEDANVHDSYSDMLLALGRTAESIGELEIAARLQPNNADRHSRLGVALGRNGRLRDALDQFEEALRLNPSDESARQNAAHARRLLSRS